MIESDNPRNVPFESSNQRMYMKKIVGFIGLAVLLLMVGCSSMAPSDTRQWQPTAVTDFKSVAGKWEGLLVRNPRTRDDDWVTLVIGDTGAFDFASFRTIGVFAGKGKLALTDGNL